VFPLHCRNRPIQNLPKEFTLLSALLASLQITFLIYNKRVIMIKFQQQSNIAVLQKAPLLLLNILTNIKTVQCTINSIHQNFKGVLSNINILHCTLNSIPYYFNCVPYNHYCTLRNVQVVLGKCYGMVLQLYSTLLDPHVLTYELYSIPLNVYEVPTNFYRRILLHHEIF